MPIGETAVSKRLAHRQETPGDWFVRRELCAHSNTTTGRQFSVAVLAASSNARSEHAFHRHIDGHRALVLHMLVSAAEAAAAARSKRTIRGRGSAKESARIDQSAVTRICGSGSDFLTVHHLDQYRSLLPSTHTHTHTTHDARRTDSAPRLCAGSTGAAGGWLRLRRVSAFSTASALHRFPYRCQRPSPSAVRTLPHRAEVVRRGVLCRNLRNDGRELAMLPCQSTHIAGATLAVSVGGFAPSAVAAPINSG